MQINSCLDHLLERADRLKERIGSVKSHQAASASLVATANGELAAPTEPPRRPARAAMPASPVRRPRAHTTVAGAGGRHSLAALGADVPPLEALLQTLSVHIDLQDGHAQGDDHEAAARQRVAALSRAVAERSDKESDVAHSGQETFERAVTTHLDDARQALQLLRDSLLAESPYGQVHLADPDVDGSIGLLSHEVAQLRDRLHRAEVHAASGKKSDKKEEILQRWG